MSEPGALVVGGDYRGLGIVRSLGRRGIRVWVVADRGTLASASRYVERRVAMPRRPDAAQVRFLTALADDNDLRGWVMFPTAEETATLVARHHADLADRYRLTTSAWATHRFAIDKQLAAGRASALGVACPRTWHPTGRDEVATLDVDFPVILKPTQRQGATPFNDAKAWRVDNRAQLLARYDEACTQVPLEHVMVQEIVAGHDRLSLAAVARQGDVLASLVARRTRQYPVDFGRASTFIETIEDAEVQSVGELLIGDLKLTGLVEVEFQRDARDGRLRLLDVNARVWGWQSIGRDAGVDFAYLAWLLALGRRVPERRGRPGCRWVRLSTDVPTSVREIVGGRLALRPYLRSLRPPLVDAVLARDDPLPGILELPYIAAEVLSRIIANRGRSWL